MFKVKFLYTLLIAAAIAAYHLLYINRLIPYAAINALFLLIAPIGYIYSYGFSSSMVIFMWLLFFPLSVVLYRIDPLNAGLPLALFSCMAGICAGYKKIIGRETTLWEKALKEKEDTSLRLEEQLGKAKRFEEGIKAKEFEIINLYEITKKMSEGLRLEEIFRSFSTFIRDNFSFRRCSLLIFKREEDIVTVDREYITSKDDGPVSSGAAREEKRYGDKLADKFLEGFDDIYLSRSENGALFKEMGVDDPDIGSIAAIPLLSEKKMVGMLVAENLPKEDTERLIILSMQFALEIRKVLLYEMVERMAITDSLTRLYVRRHFYERFEEEFKRSEKHRFRFAVLMIDIDDFKKCNDTYGHLVGDIVLKEIARIIKENVREIDIVSRYGGEELALVLPETGDDNARVVAERLRRKIAEQAFKAYDEKLKVTVSIGFSIYPDDAADTQGLIEKADEALYKAKKSGKNLVCKYGS